MVDKDIKVQNGDGSVQPARYSLDEILAEARRLKKNRDTSADKTKEFEFYKPSYDSAVFIDKLVEENVLAVEEILLDEGGSTAPKITETEKMPNSLPLPPDAVMQAPDRIYVPGVFKDSERRFSSDSLKKNLAETEPSDPDESARLLVNPATMNESVPAPPVSSSADTPISPWQTAPEPVQEDHPKIEYKKVEDIFIKASGKSSVENVLSKTGRTEKKNSSPEPMPFEKPNAFMEKPGLRRKKSLFAATADLDPLPVIVPAEKEWEDLKPDYNLEAFAPSVKTEKQNISSYKAPEEIEGQIKLRGFEEIPLDTINEQDLENQLYENRKEKIKRFRISGVDATLESPSVQKEESPYFEYNQNISAAAVKRDLDRNYIRLFFKSIGLGLLEILLIYLGIAPGLSLYLPDLLNPSGAPAMYLIANLVLTLLVIVICRSTVFGGIASMFKGAPDSDVGVGIAAIVSFVHAGATFGFLDRLSTGELQIYVAVAGFGLLANTIGKLFIISRTSINFEYVSSDEEKYAVKPVTGHSDLVEFTKGLPGDGVNLRYSAKAGFLTRFLELSYSDDPVDKTSRRTIGFGIVGAILLYGLCFFLNRDMALASGTFAALICVGMPLTSLMIANLPLLISSYKLKKEKIMISGYAAVETNANADGVLLDATDLFPPESCMIYGIKLFNGMRIDEAILDTAGVVCAANTPLSGLFKMVVEGRMEILPVVDEYIYEDKLGISAWVYGRRILVGNREFMINHNIAMPDSFLESRYVHDNRKLLYLAEGGHLAAMFVFSYAPDSSISDQISMLHKAGINIMVRTNDPNITEEFLTECFGGTESCYTILRPVAGKLFREKYSSVTEDTASGIVHKGGVASFIKGIMESVALRYKIYFAATLQTIGIILGFALISFFALSRNLNPVGVPEILIYQLFWMAAALILPLFVGGSPERSGRIR